MASAVAVVAIVAIAAGACGSDAAGADANVDFLLDAPLCSSVVPVTLLIDNVPVGVDTFRVGLIPSHTRTRAFAVAPGTHQLDVRFTKTNYTWPEKTVTLSAGASATDTLPLYCS